MLSEEIHYRKGSKQPFDETDIWYLIYNLVCAKRDVSLFHKKVGDIRPENIFINEKGEIKVACLNSWPGA